jgi:Superinfection immunity protein
METIFPGMILVLVVLGFYFLPAIIAAARHHRHCLAVFLTNLFFGWTFLGWVIALIWAVMNQREVPRARTTTPIDAPTNPRPVVDPVHVMRPTPPRRSFVDVLAGER